MKILNYDNCEYDIILLAGQSNAYGTGKGPTDNPWQVRDDIMMLKNDFEICYKRPDENTVYIDINAQKDGYIEKAKENLENDGVTTIGNFSLTFAKMYADKYLQKGRKVLIVSTAIGGTGFKGEHWGKNDKMFLRMVDMLDSALALNKNNKLVAVLWHQGEHDAYENRDLSFDGIKEYYDEKFTEFLGFVRERYGKEVPFVCAGFTYAFINEFKKGSDAVIEVLQNKMQNDEMAKFVDASGIKCNSDIGLDDIYHFNKKGLEILGARYFDGFEQIKNNK
jgi:hypothetical protein